MKRRQRESIVAALDQKLSDQGSWCGETHLQKGIYFLQEMLGVPTDFEYILYKYGPFSRELRDELGSMRSDGLIDVVPQPAPYGPSLIATSAAERQLLARWPRTLARYEARLDFVAKKLGGMGVGALERLATALWVVRELPDASDPQRAARIHELKPHVSHDLALNALSRVAKMETSAKRLR